jgi:hypothetical protein
MIDARNRELQQIGADKIRRNPALIRRVQDTLVRWLRAVDDSERVYDGLVQWKRRLEEHSLDQVLAFMSSEDEEACRLRLSTPFVGLFSDQERMESSANIKLSVVKPVPLTARSFLLGNFALCCLVTLSKQRMSFFFGGRLLSRPLRWLQSRAAVAPRFCRARSAARRLLLLRADWSAASCSRPEEGGGREQNAVEGEGGFRWSPSLRAGGVWLGLCGRFLCSCRPTS